MVNKNGVDILNNFGEACRAEFRSLHLGTGCAAQLSGNGSPVGEPIAKLAQLLLFFSIDLDQGEALKDCMPVLHQRDEPAFETALRRC